MADVKFGIPQIKNPTPSTLNLWVRIITVVVAVFMAWMATASVMGPNTKDIINQICGLLLGLINGLAPLFGVETTSRYVPADQVTAMDTPTK